MSRPITILNPLPTFRDSSGLLQLGPSNRRQRVYFSEEEEVQIIRWLLSRRHEYAEKRVPRAEFWERCGNWMQQQFGRAYARVDRSIGQIEKRRRREIDAAIQASGVAASDTHWKQAVDSWIEFIDKLKQTERKEREERFAARQNNIHRGPRAGRRGRKRRRTEELDSQSPTPESSPSPEPPSSRSSSRSFRQAQTAITAQNLPLILSSFSSSFVKSMEPMVRHMQEARSQDIQELKQEFKNQNEVLERRLEQLFSARFDRLEGRLEGQLEEFQNTMKDQLAEYQNTMQRRVAEIQDTLQGIMEILKNRQKNI
ncbi:hypothetical protein DTO271D3_1098 [Paecilomyces variotii]|nr:hypothetical protein DTO271D3_1098 [Paecilomyces variotii]